MASASDRLRSLLEVQAPIDDTGIPPSTTPPARQRLEQELRQGSLSGSTSFAQQGTDPLDPGLSFRTQMRRMDNDEERKAYLDQRFGEGNYFVGGSGSIIVKPAGVKRFTGKDAARSAEISTEGFGSSLLTGAIAQGPEQAFAAAATMIAPEYEVPALTARVGQGLAKQGFGMAKDFITRVLAKGAVTSTGFVGGKLADEAVKAGEGTLRTSPSEELGRVNEQIASGMIAEGIGEPLKGAGRVLRRAYGPINPQSAKDMTASVLGRGMVPTVEQSTPVSKILPFEQRLAHYIFGNPAEKGNIAALDKEMRSYLLQAGTPANEVDAIMAQLKGRDLSASEKPLGEAVTQQAEGRLGGAQAEVTSTLDRAKTLTDQALRQVSTRIGGARGDVLAQVRDDIGNVRDNFSQSMQQAYSRIDQLVGGKKVVPTYSVKQQAKAIYDSFPKDKTGTPIIPEGQILGILKRLQNMNPYETFANMQQLRSDIGRLGYDPTLFQGVEGRRFNQLKDSIDRAFSLAQISPAAPAANAARLAANAAYHDGMKKFEDTTVKAIVKSAETSGVVEPEQVARLIVQSGNVSAAQRIKDLVRPQTWRQVGAQTWDQLIKDSTDQADNVDFTKLRTKVKALGYDMMRELYGQSAADDATELLRQGSALQGKYPIEKVRPGQFRSLLESAQSQQATVDNLMKTDFVAKLGKPGPDQDHAVDYLLQPDSAKRVAQAKKFYGEQSPEWEKLRAAAMARILGSAVGKGESPFEKLLSGSALKDTLANYKDSTLKEWFGQDLVDNLHSFADDMQFMTAKGKHPGTGTFAAAFLILSPLVHLPAIAELGISGQLMAQPWFIKWLSMGAPEGPISRTVAKMVSGLTRSSAQTLGPAAPNRGEQPGVLPQGPDQPSPARRMLQQVLQ